MSFHKNSFDEKVRTTNPHMMKYLIDAHCHILPGVDDGAANLDEAKKMLQIAHKEGIRYIIATPHFHPQRGHASPEKIQQSLMILRQEAEKIDEKMRVYRGRELLYREDLEKDLESIGALTMNDRTCILVEFHGGEEYEYIRHGLQKLQMAGYQVILAHIERYKSVLEDIDRAMEIYDMGILIQINAESIMGKSGRKVKAFVRELLEEEMVFCVGSDAHDTHSRPPKMKKAAAYVEKHCGYDYAKAIFNDNIKNLLLRRKEEGL